MPAAPLIFWSCLRCQRGMILDSKGWSKDMALSICAMSAARVGCDETAWAADGRVGWDVLLLLRLEELLLRLGVSLYMLGLEEVELRVIRSKAKGLPQPNGTGDDVRQGLRTPARPARDDGKATAGTPCESEGKKSPLRPRAAPGSDGTTASHSGSPSLAVPLTGAGSPITRNHAGARRSL
jgi:hypothetical protein